MMGVSTPPRVAITEKPTKALNRPRLGSGFRDAGSVEERVIVVSPKKTIQSQL
jgi:ribosomal protein L16/L10AE